MNARPRQRLTECLRCIEKNPQGLWYSISDALPETVTVLVERKAEGCGLKVQRQRHAPQFPQCLQPSDFPAKTAGRQFPESQKLTAVSRGGGSCPTD
jgi:hypothetical protein